MAEQAGNLAFYALSCPEGLDAASFIKKLTVQIEETHPFGRLYDIDVYGMDGKGISRQELGLPVRKCLICDKDAKICGRSRSHSVEELQQKVYEIIQNVSADR